MSERYVHVRLCSAPFPELSNHSLAMCCYLYVHWETISTFNSLEKQRYVAWLVGWLVDSQLAVVP